MFLPCSSPIWKRQTREFQGGRSGRTADYTFVCRGAPAFGQRRNSTRTALPNVHFLLPTKLTQTKTFDRTKITTTSPESPSAHAIYSRPGQKQPTAAPQRPPT